MKTITPTTRCIRCGLMAHQHPQRHKTGKPAAWQCGHTVAGNNAAPLALEWSTCNLSHGGRLGNARRWGPDRVPGTGPRPPARTYPHWPGHYDHDDDQGVGRPPCLMFSGRLCPTCAAWRAMNPRRKG
jgi:hypothetical protein